MKSKTEEFFLDLCKLCKEHKASLSIKNGRIHVEIDQLKDDFGVYIDGAGSVSKIAVGKPKPDYEI